MTRQEQIEKLEAAGLTVKEWKDRLYVKDGNRELGYLTVEDDGTTGTCKNIKTGGRIAAILRGER